MKVLIRLAVLPCLLALSGPRLVAQPELEPWGNLTGIRIDGQLMEFGSSLQVRLEDGRVLTTAKERQTPHYSRQGKIQIVSTNLDSLYFVERVENVGNNSARVVLRCTAHADLKPRSVFFYVDVPKDDADILEPESKGMDVRWPGHSIKVIWDEAELTKLERPTSSPYIRIGIALKVGDWSKNDAAQIGLLITANGPIDRRPVHVHLNTSAPGRPFDGVGGNFRIQNTRLDPEVIDYCLKNMRVAWGRVELPWRQWQPFEDVDPLKDARSGHLSPAVARAMEMAHTLGEKKIPFILSAWFPPEWAVVGPVSIQQPGPDHVWGNPLNHARDTDIYKSIADYIVFLKERDSVEPKYFSFNESDLGINVRQTAKEHDALIKGLGAYLASRGLGTRVLLGDNSDATTWSFVDVAREDAAARRWIGAISFHSWRGWDSATLKKWADDATALRLPLLVAEGSIDAAAWHYPAIFSEPGYALKEIGLYIRLMALCQPASILQWQLTSDYSLLAGGGIFGDTGALHPTQRFYNLKQLSMTPPGLFAMPVSCDRPDITVAGLGDRRRNRYVVHLVNEAATREVLLSGLPAGVNTLTMYTTNQVVSVKEGKPVPVIKGQAHFTLAARSFVTLIGR